MRSISKLLNVALVGLLLLTSSGTHAQTQEETALWNSVKDSRDADDYEAYLDEYPDGVYAPLAKRRIASIERTRQTPGQTAAPAPAPQPADVAPAKNTKAKLDPKAIPNDRVANAQVDEGFKRWSAQWMFDRYVPGSARATERGFKDGTYVTRGVFDFVRGGGRLTIPFAAAYGRAGETFSLSNLCYNDVTTGMTACINPNSSADLQHAGMQSRQFLGSIVAVGMLAAMSTTETCIRRDTLFGGAYLECY